MYFDFAYDEAHRRSTLTYPNGAVTTSTFNGVSNLTNLVTAKGGTTLDSWAYGYDAVGNRTSKTALTFAETYKYDDVYRLIGAERTGLPNRWFFDYDPAGNRLRAQTGDTVSEATYDDRNQLQTQAGEGSLRWRGTIDEPGNVTFTSATVNDKPARILSGNTFETTLDLAAGLNTVTIKATDSASPPNLRTVNYQMNVTGASALYDYDANGNLTEKLEGATNWTYEWNAENQLKRVLKNSAEVARFAYDALGRRVEKVVGADVHTWLYDGEDILRETEGGITYWFLHGPGIDEPLARYASTGQIVYGHADGLGSLTKVTNPLGEVIGTRRYDPFGNIEVGAAEGSYAFTGREWDPETGLYYYRARYYDPKIGRFISEDPIGFEGGINFYTYVANNPANWIDPWGLKVYRCCRDVEVNRFVNGVAKVFRYKHCFIKTDTMEAGMGPADQGPLPACPIGTQTAIVPHTGQSSGSDCEEIPDADEACVNIQLRTGRSTGMWTPTNNCNTVTNDIIKHCSPLKCPTPQPGPPRTPPR